MNIQLIMTVLLLCVTTLGFAKDDLCQVAEAKIGQQINGLGRTIQDLDSLLSSEGTPLEPIAVVFQIDLTDDLQRIKRIEELTQASINSEALPVAELNDCFKNSYIPSEIVKLKKEINSKKLEFLKLEASRRSELLDDYFIRRKDGLEKIKIDNQIKETKEKILAAELNPELSQNSDIANDDKSKSFLSLLYGAQTENEKIYLSFLDFYKIEKEKLDSLSITAKIDKKDTLTRLEAANVKWRIIVDELDGVFSKLNSYNFKSFPELDKDSINELPPSVKAKLEEAVKRQKELRTDVIRHVESLKKDSFHILSKAGKKRARLLKSCDREGDGCKRKKGLTQENIDDFVKELRVIPLKIEAGLVAKWFEVNRKFRMGIEGWIDLLYQVFLLFILIIFPIFTSRILDWVTEKVKLKLETVSILSVPQYGAVSSFHFDKKKLIPFINPFGMLLVVTIAVELVQSSELSELSSVLFYVQLYYCYRLTRSFVKIILGKIFLQANIENTNKKEIAILARNISRLVFIQIGILHLVADTAREALVYRLIVDIGLIIYGIFIFWQAFAWREEVKFLFKTQFPKFSLKILPFGDKFYSFLFYPFMLIASLAKIIWQLISRYLLRLDLTKRLLSEIFKKKLQSSEVKTQVFKKPLPEYLKSFELSVPASSVVFINRESSPQAPICEKITKWVNGKTFDDLVILTGDRGIGKTSLLNQIYENVEKTCPTLLTRVPGKILRSQDLYAWLSEILNTKIQGLDEYVQFERGLENKRIVLVDDLHNLFLSTVGGFEAYEAFVELISLKTRNIFWCLSFNSRAWTYLKGVFGREHFYGTVYPMKAWKDFEIQQLIQVRHEQTKYERRFNRSIQAYSNTEAIESRFESQFFRLLWGQSRGNPRSALTYWISAISENDKNIIDVGIPDFVDSELIVSMSDEGHFLLAFIVRHENLSFREMITTTNISPSVIRKCLEEFSDKNFAWTDEADRVRITSKSQHVIDYYLIGKNFLYE